MARLLLIFGVLLLGAGGQCFAATEMVDHDAMLMDHGTGHMMDMDGGMVMGQNRDTLPESCSKISEDVEITVHAGHKYSEKFPGRMFAFDQQEWRVKPCTRLTVHFINEDDVRHQWMMHGLPKYIYKSGMFHLEVTGPGKISGTLILPANDETYLVHCDLAQHMEKGMKAQLVVGKGSTDLPSIPGLTPLAFPDSYDVAPIESESSVKSVTASAVSRAAPVASASPGPLSFGMLAIGLAFGLLVTPLLARYYKGMTASQVISHTFDLVVKLISSITKTVGWLVNLLMSFVKKEQ